MPRRFFLVWEQPQTLPIFAVIALFGFFIR